jgi:hypothetical protein
MFVDRVVQEIRDNGARIAEECGGDIHRMAERFRTEQARNADRVVSRKTRNLAPSKPNDQASV